MKINPALLKSSSDYGQEYILDIHDLDPRVFEVKQVHLNIFSCHNFSTDDAKAFIEKRLGGKIVKETNLVRK